MEYSVSPVSPHYSPYFLLDLFFICSGMPLKKGEASLLTRQGPSWSSGLILSLFSRMADNELDEEDVRLYSSFLFDDNVDILSSLLLLLRCFSIHFSFLGYWHTISINFIPFVQLAVSFFSVFVSLSTVLLKTPSFVLWVIWCMWFLLFLNWIVYELNCWIVELLNCWIVYELNCLWIELLNCWIVIFLNLYGMITQ